jgi:hypothetical protein
MMGLIAPHDDLAIKTVQKFSIKKAFPIIRPPSEK